MVGFSLSYIGIVGIYNIKKYADTNDNSEYNIWEFFVIFNEFTSLALRCQKSRNKKQAFDNENFDKHHEFRNQKKREMMYPPIEDNLRVDVHKFSFSFRFL